MGLWSGHGDGQGTKQVNSGARYGSTQQLTMEDLDSIDTVSFSMEKKNTSFLFCGGEKSPTLKHDL